MSSANNVTTKYNAEKGVPMIANPDRNNHYFLPKSVRDVRLIDHSDRFSPSRGWIAGNVALFVGDGLFLTIAENMKTSVQLNKVDLSNGLPESTNLANLTEGLYTNFWRGVVHASCKYFGSSTLDEILFQANLPVPYPLQGVLGMAVGTILTYPLDLVRTRQGAVTFIPDSELKDRHLSVSRIYHKYGLSALYSGLHIGLIYGVAQQIISRSLQGYVFHPSYFSPISTSLKPQLASFCALAVAKILLNPIEIARKRQQNSVALELGMVDTLSEIYEKEGLAGLFSGWYFSIPESFAAIIVTHLTYRGCKYLINRYYEL